MNEFFAQVKSVRGTTKHSLCEIDLWGNPVATEAIGEPKTLRIESTDSGVFLLRLDAEGECLADTWHEDISSAMRQADFEYVLVSGWHEQDK